MYTIVSHVFLAVSIVGFVLMFGGVVFAITGPRVAGGRERTDGAAGSARAKRGKGSGGFTNRMEDRFRRRFEE